MRLKIRIKIPKLRLELNDEHRRVFAEKTLDFAFIVAGTLIFGQLFAEREYSLPLAIVGVVTIFTGYFVSYILLKGIEGVSKT